MTFSIGDIVTTVNMPDTHKRVCEAFPQNTSVKLEWWDELGKQEESVHRDNCRYKDDKPTKQFLESKQIWENSNKKYHDEHPEPPKRTSNFKNTKRATHFGGNHGNGGAE